MGREGEQERKVDVEDIANFSWPVSILGTLKFIGWLHCQTSRWRPRRLSGFDCRFTDLISPDLQSYSIRLSLGFEDYVFKKPPG